MKLTEKIKVQKSVLKIQSGEFDEGDVELLFMRLRAYSEGFHIFREAADLVAHNDVRDKGVINESLDALFLRLKFYMEYTLGEKVIYLDGAFPSYFKKLLLYQVKKFSDRELKDDFKSSRQKLCSIINNLFQEDRKARTCVLKNPSASASKLNLIFSLLDWIKVEPVFTVEDLMCEILQVLRLNEIEFLEYALREQQDKIILSFILLLHMTEFKLSAGGSAICKIEIGGGASFGESSKKELVVRLPNALAVVATSNWDTGKKPFSLSHNIFNTEIDASVFCDPSIYNEEERVDFYLNKCKAKELKPDLQFLAGKLVSIS